MPTFRISKPVSGGGSDDKFPRDQHLEHLVLHIAETFTAEQVDTVHGPKDAVPVDHIICTDCLEVWSDQLVFGAAVVPRLNGAEGGVVVGRLGQGLARPGRSAPWTLDDPTDADLDQAEKFLQEYASTLRSGRIVIDTKAIAEARNGDPRNEQF